MLSILKRKTRNERLRSKYERLMAEGHKLLATDQEQSIRKYVEAQMIINRIPLNIK